jgi:hypothetical protein
MSSRNIKEILEQMKSKKVDCPYQGTLPAGINKIKRLAWETGDCTEVIFENLDEELFRCIVTDNGLVYRPKRRRSGSTCGCVANLFETMRRLDNSARKYTIKKPRRPWFSATIADVVDHSVRVYDTKKSIEIAAEVLEQYLEEQSKKASADTK